MAVEDYLRQISQNKGFSFRDSALTDTIYGLNINTRGALVQSNTEDAGYVFFTRPDLNLSYDNLQVDRVMQMLLLESPVSINRSIRSYLDPAAHRAGLSCPNVDPLNPFIPMLSNACISVSGWEDFVLGTYTSQPGLYREAYSYIDDVPYSYGTYDLQCSFRNLPGDPVSFMHIMWERYAGLAYEGRVMPYPENVMLNVMDYNTRIYRLVTDTTRTYVTRLFCCGAAFPYTAGLANFADYNINGTESPYSTVNDQVTISFRAMGFRYYDHIIIYDFNELVQDFNSSMEDGTREKVMHKLMPYERDFFNYRAYPRIDPATMELEWWIPNATYEQYKAGLLR